ncbi:MAG: UDP-N-acetylmuramate--L-alanine ligase [Treponema sp.]|jgi:UDP-N-acetylmuramate--alanine ligase|nr:UDP-N-acetylmuramate--L-alanine ligase [Treponema sp.]
MDLGRLLSQRARLYFVGIKGTGASALAELFFHAGLPVSGSDTAEVFYTDAILKELGIPYYEHFDRSHVPPDAALVIHSAAYNAETNPEMAEALKLGIPLLKYTDALGAYSALFDSSAIAGVHGKTTTTALAGILFRAARLPAKVLAGSAVSAFGGRSTLNLGDKYFAAETCEYRRHFMAFKPRNIVLTSVESDHQDCFPGYDDIRDAFVEFVLTLPENGGLIYCADDPGASEVTELVKHRRNDITLIPYGFKAPGDYRIISCNVQNERTCFRLECFSDTEFKLQIPGRHIVLDAAAALALATLLVKKEFSAGGYTEGWTAAQLQNAVGELEAFAGSRRRSEILGEKGGVLFMDDYGHHPTAIRSTLLGLREFYPRRRIVLSFMSHTYSRTAALLDDFAESFLPADLVFLHKIYASAREVYSGGVNGKTLFDKTRTVFENKRAADSKVFYVDEPEDAALQLKTILRKGDLFITMGAGDNWRLGKKMFEEVS